MIGRLTSVTQPALIGDSQVQWSGQTYVGRNIRRVVTIEALPYDASFDIRWDESVRGRNDVGGSRSGNGVLGLETNRRDYLDRSNGLGVGENAFFSSGDTAGTGLLQIAFAFGESAGCA